MKGRAATPGLFLFSNMAKARGTPENATNRSQRRPGAVPIRRQTDQVGRREPPARGRFRRVRNHASTRRPFPGTGPQGFPRRHGAGDLCLPLPPDRNSRGRRRNPTGTTRVETARRAQGRVARCSPPRFLRLKPPLRDPSLGRCGACSHRPFSWAAQSACRRTISMRLAVIPGQAKGLSPEPRTAAAMNWAPTRGLFSETASVLGSGLFANAKPRNDGVLPSKPPKRKRAARRPPAKFSGSSVRSDNDDLRARGNAVEQVDHVDIAHADAAR